MAKLIKADGTERELKPGNGKKWTLAELQAAVAGDIEIMPDVEPLRLVMNERGRLLDLPINRKATDLVLERLDGKPLWYVPVIRGDVLVLAKGERM